MSTETLTNSDITQNNLEYVAKNNDKRGCSEIKIVYNSKIPNTMQYKLGYNKQTRI